jgi:hypothetical protein
MSSFAFAQIELPLLSELGPEPTVNADVNFDRWRRTGERTASLGIDAAFPTRVFKALQTDQTA